MMKEAERIVNIFLGEGTEKMEALLPIDKAAELLGISPWTVRKWLHGKKLRGVRIGRRVLLEQSELRRVVEEGRSDPTDQADGVKE